MLDYIIKVILFQTLFLAAYDLFLKRETFFQWNRVYLILTSLLAYIIPLLKIDRVTEIVSQEYSLLLPEVMLSPTATIEQELKEPQVVYNYIQIIFWIGVIIASAFFLLKLFRIIQLIYNNEREYKGNYVLVLLNNSKAFSFFNYIFLGIIISPKSKKQIVEHELIHVQQKHSLDLLVFEFQKIVCWFNPFSYLFQQRISELHEFIADSKAIKEKDKTTYFNQLLTETFGVQHISFINPFFKHSLIKKRIVMLHKSRSKDELKLKYLLLIPILASMLVYSSCETTEPEIQKDTSVKELIGELNAIAEEGKLSDEDIKSLIVLLSKTSNKDIVVSEKVQKLRQYMMEYLLQEKKNKILNESVQTQDYSNAKEVPFAVIEQAPVFPGCEDDENLKKCLQESISNHIAKNFNPSIAKPLGLEAGKKKVYVLFTIDKNGNITDAKARGPHELLEEEALRVIKGLPMMQPGEQDGKKVGVKYTVPISLVVE